MREKLLFPDAQKTILEIKQREVITQKMNEEFDGKKLEQVTKGYDFNNSGKRVDLFMKTRGLVNSLCFGVLPKTSIKH